MFCIWCGLDVGKSDGMELRYYRVEWEQPSYTKGHSVQVATFIHVNCLDLMAYHLLKMKVGQVKAK